MRLRHVQAGLEALAFNLAQELAGSKFVRLSIEAPCGRFRVTIPGYIDVRADVGVQRYDGRILVGETCPIVAEGAVVLDTGTEEARIHVGVEDGRAIAGELSYCALRAPSDEDVAVGKNLSAALGLGKQIIRREVAAYEVSSPRVGVQLQNFAAASGSSVDFGASAVLGAMGTVVIEADDLNVTFLLQPASVVLETELGAVGHLEVRPVTI